MRMRDERSSSYISTSDAVTRRSRLLEDPLRPLSSCDGIRKGFDNSQGWECPSADAVELNLTATITDGWLSWSLGTFVRFYHFT